jgi:hypothetical protein
MRPELIRVPPWEHHSPAQDFVVLADFRTPVVAVPESSEQILFLEEQLELADSR